MASTYRVVTLNQFIIDRQADFPYASGEFSRLLYHLAVAAKIVNKKVNKAGLVDILGDAGSSNVQGEEQKKLDVLANEQFIMIQTWPKMGTTSSAWILLMGRQISTSMFR